MSLSSRGNEGVPAEQKNRPESPGPSCLCMKSDKSMGLPVTFGNEERMSPDQREERSDSPGPSCLSMKTDKSMGLPVTFRSGKRMISDQREPEEESRCSVCEEVLRAPVSIPCGHSYCKQCITKSREHLVSSGEFGCPQCTKRFRHLENEYGEDVIQMVKNKHKATLKKTCDNIYEGISKSDSLQLNQIYTELYITEGESEGVDTEHEVWQIENASKTHTSQDNAINYKDIFKPLPKQRKSIRTVLMKGIAGIGKTVSVQKFILDWAEKKTNQEIDFLLVLPFKTLNLIQDHHSLYGLLNIFHPHLSELSGNYISNCKVMFILDGLDESRLPLDFHSNKKLSDIKEESSVDVLVANLIKRNLLPSALLWITSRPAAANQIPPECIDRVIETQGFNDPQKEEYFKKRFSDKNMAKRIITHMKSSRSLHILCHIPVFCWISATVLEQAIKENESVKVPQTLTEIITHFLLILTNQKNQKYSEKDWTDPQNLLKSDREFLLKLGKLAFENLQIGNLMFYEEDLRHCGINVTEASVYSGICTEILKVESVLHQKKVYCFVHLLIQEFFAALYAFQSYTVKNMEALRYVLEEGSKSSRSFPRASTTSLGDMSLHEFLKRAVDKAFENKNGHLDLFIRFLLGISLESNQRLLSGLLTQTESSAEISKKVLTYLKAIKRQNLSPERCLNLFHCMIEMRDNSVHKDIEEYLKSKEEAVTKLSPAHCSVLAYMLLMSEEVLEEFDLKKYNTSMAGWARLLPVVRCCRKALLSDSKLTESSCETLAFALQMPNSPVRELDLSNNDLKDSGVKLLSAGLGSPHCKLEILRLSGCQVTGEGCSSLASALESNPSHLRDLDLSYNHPGDSGVKLLSAGLEDPNWRLKALNVKYGGCSRLKLGLNKYACDLTLDPDTAHSELSLSEENRKVTGVGDHGELSLSEENRKVTGVRAHSELSLSEENRKVTGVGAHSELSQSEVNRKVTGVGAQSELSQSEENRKVTGVGEEQLYPGRPERFESVKQVLCREGLSGRCYWEVEAVGSADIGVTYGDIVRRGTGDRCKLGRNERSWSLTCSNKGYSVQHGHSRMSIPAAPSRSHRLGVYLDWEAGTLSFYRVSGTQHRALLHTFHCRFTEPLYPGFEVPCPSCVSLCQIG
ncbi:NLR family CARD domain-containing protein 3-like isoform X1 [Esox lucius]|nr:NLR family CARD domain-containing protein 3-like isoform X1 [Esox lucius]XP_028973607.2 NLR family CARD domain-containing protein 3-like isoform X1 [Esox lucius]